MGFFQGCRGHVEVSVGPVRLRAFVGIPRPDDVKPVPHRRRFVVEPVERRFDGSVHMRR
jgi:hypothetical protein